MDGRGIWLGEDHMQSLFSCTTGRAGWLAGWVGVWRENLTSRESGCRQWENKAATHPAYRHAATPTYIHFSQHPSTVRSIRPSLYTQPHHRDESCSYVCMLRSLPQAARTPFRPLARSHSPPLLSPPSAGSVPQLYLFLHLCDPPRPSRYVPFPSLVALPTR